MSTSESYSNQFPSTATVSGNVSMKPPLIADKKKQASFRSTQCVNGGKMEKENFLKRSHSLLSSFKRKLATPAVSKDNNAESIVFNYSLFEEENASRTIVVVGNSPEKKDDEQLVKNDSKVLKTPTVPYLNEMRKVQMTRCKPFIECTKTAPDEKHLVKDTLNTDDKRPALPPKKKNSTSPSTSGSSSSDGSPKSIKSFDDLSITETMFKCEKELDELQEAMVNLQLATLLKSDPIPKQKSLIRSKPPIPPKRCVSSRINKPQPKCNEIKEETCKLSHQAEEACDEGYLIPRELLTDPLKSNDDDEHVYELYAVEENLQNIVNYSTVKHETTLVQPSQQTTNNESHDLGKKETNTEEAKPRGNDKTDINVLLGEIRDLRQRMAVQELAVSELQVELATDNARIAEIEAELSRLLSSK